MADHGLACCESRGVGGALIDCVLAYLPRTVSWRVADRTLLNCLPR
ncbi:hypothetical protein OG203_39595 [Nocardia sp. NBC_01499]